MRLLRSVISSLLLLTSVTIYAVEENSTDGTELLTEYLKNLGAYLGFDITEDLKDPLATLLDDGTATNLIQRYSFLTLLGAIPVNTYSDALAYFVPSNTENYSLINDMANYTFAKQPSSSSYDQISTGEDGGISVSALIDQTKGKDGADTGTYQSDPVTQSILNTLATPQTTYCLNNNGDALLNDCSYLYDTKVMAQVIGTIPGTADAFSVDYNSGIIAQLNSNTLIAPLLYTTDTSDSSSDNDGLVAKNQAQEAENFIRYATSSVAPIALAQRKEYDDMYTKTINNGEKDETSLFNQKLAQEKIAKYLTKLRTYSAASSVPTATLYSMLSKRMPQATSTTDKSKQTSQALSEFQMATRRLYDPAKTDSDGQWIDQINEASTATVQKEMAILLSEINYQLYLSRQQDEKALVTLSLLLIQSLSTNPPSFTSDAAIETTS